MPKGLSPSLSQPLAPSFAGEVVVSIQGVDFSYNLGERQILSGLNMEFKRGQVVAVMGGSGCGKTTILRLIGGQYTAQRGQVMFEGQDIGKLSTAQLMQARRRMGMLFQFGALFTDLSVFENVAFPLREHTNLSEALLRSLVSVSYTHLTLPTIYSV